MSRSRSRRRRSRTTMLGRIRSATTAASALRVASAIGLAACLLATIATTTLPAAIVETAPDTALALSAHLPNALVEQAERARSRLLARSGSPTDNATVVSITDPSTIAAGDEADALRRAIREHAEAAIRADPLNARAYRLLAEVVPDPFRTRELMRASASRSRRETVASFWLLNDSLVRSEYSEGLRHAANLLQTAPQLADYVVAYLGTMADTPEGRTALVEGMSVRPPWRTIVMRRLPSHMKSPTAMLELMRLLRAAGSAPSDAELASTIDRLLNAGLIDMAYSAWLQQLAGEQLAALQLITNAGFEDELSGLAFDWRISAGQNAITEVRPVPDDPAQHALYVQLSSERIRFAEPSQVLRLTPARYRLTGRWRGKLMGKRGLRWHVSCLNDKRLIAQSAMLSGEVGSWTEIAFDFEIAKDGQCRGQRLRLVHDARSESERFLEGEAWFDDLSLSRL